MKKIIVFVTMIIIVMACNSKGTSIKINKTKHRHELVADYPGRKTKKLERYLNAALENGDDILLDEQAGTGKEIKLTNGTVFYLRYNPGKLEMEMLMEKNNATGHKFFDQITEGVKEALN
jgi:hypothetical protein